VWNGSAFVYGPVSGTTKRVLTSGGAISAPPTWEVPTLGTVEDVALTHYGDAFVVAVTDGSGPDVSIAITKKVGALATDYINGLGNITAFPTLDNYVSWTIEADDANTEAITSGAVVDFVGVGNVSTAWDATSNELRISASENPGTGTQFTLPVWDTTSTLGDSMVSQDAATGTTLTIAGNVGIKGAALVELQVNASSGYAETRLVGASGSGGSLEFYDDTTKLADIYADPTKKLYFRTNGQTTALTLDDGQDATFAGDVKLLDNKILQIGTGNDLELYHNSGSVFSQIRNNTGDLYISNLASDKDIIFQGKDGATAFTALTLGMGETGNATFAGDVIGGSTKTLKSWRRLQTDANNDWGLNNNAGSPVISISAMGTPLTSLTTFAGNVEIDGNLTVDGHIIHGGGGGGTGKGGTFTKLFTTASGATNRAFTIVRGTSGAMVFDVMMTSDTSNACSIAKKFTVVKQFGVDPNVFKIIDTGPDGSNDFTVAFTQHTTDTSIKCVITPVTLGIQTIGITIDLGFGKNDAVVTMNASSA